MRPALIAALAAMALNVAACGDPAPGEGVDKPHEQKTMPAVVSASEAINSPHIPSIDLQSMDEAEYEKVLPGALACSFSYSLSAPPVLAISMAEGPAAGVVKIHGRLVETHAQHAVTLQTLPEGATFVADGLRLEVIPDRDESIRHRDGTMQREANLVFELEQGLKVGYRGWYACAQE